MENVERGGTAGAETSDIGAAAAPGRERRMTAGRKRDAVLRLLRGDPMVVSPPRVAASSLRVTPKSRRRHRLAS